MLSGDRIQGERVGPLCFEKVTRIDVADIQQQLLPGANHTIVGQGGTGHGDRILFTVDLEVAQVVANTEFDVSLFVAGLPKQHPSLAQNTTDCEIRKCCKACGAPQLQYP